MCACASVTLQHPPTDRLALFLPSRGGLWRGVLFTPVSGSWACRNPRRGSSVVVLPRGAPRRSRCEPGLERQLLRQLLPPSAPQRPGGFPDAAGFSRDACKTEVRADGGAGVLQETAALV